MVALQAMRSYYKNMKYVPPASVTVLPNSAAPTGMWPIGTLYYHKDSNTYFRFLTLGGRWDAHYGISTQRGIMVASLVDGKRIYGFEMPCVRSQVTAGTKQRATEFLLDAIAQMQQV